MVENDDEEKQQVDGLFIQMSERNLRDIDFDSIEEELHREDVVRERAIARLNIFNQPNQQDNVFVEKAHRESRMKIPQPDQKYLMVRVGRNGG